MAFPYEKAFRAAEDTLVQYGSRRLAPEKIRAELDCYKNFERRELTDQLCFSILVYVVFYSGFRAATVTSRSETIDRHFPDWRTVADYDEGDVDRILSDAQMIRNRRKITACVENARIMRELIDRHGSFNSYVSSFEPRESFENLLLLKEELEARFQYLGGVTVYHFLTDIGMPVLKPDRVICRIFHRLGLADNERQLLKTVIQGKKFAAATGLAIRYIDIVFVAYGQAQSKEFGLDRGICLKKPRCHICGLTQFCSRYREKGSPKSGGS